VEPVFLGLDDVLAMHRDQIERYGGSSGIRDMGLLRSAVAMPAAAFRGRYVHADLSEVAAAYLFYIVRNHPFVDGNKRTGAVAAYVFLALNALTLTASEKAFEQLVRDVAEGKRGKADAAVFFREHTGR
jgi:death-on-curing protein